MGITIIRRTKAAGALLRGPDGKVSDAIASEGHLTCAEVERQAIEIAYREGVPQTEQNILIVPMKE